MEESILRKSLRFLYVNLKYFFKKIIFYSIIFLKFPTKHGCLFIIKDLNSKLFKVVHSNSFNRKRADSIYGKIKYYYNLASLKKKTLPEMHFAMSSAAMTIGEISDWKNLRDKIFEEQETLASKKLNKGYDFRVLEPYAILRTLGNTLHLDTWIKSKLLGFQKNLRFVMPITPYFKKKTINKCLLDYWSAYIEVVYDSKQANYYLTQLKDLRIWYELYVPCGEKANSWSHSAAAYVQSKWNEQDRDPILKLSDDHLERGWKVLKEMGMPNNSWFVTLHARDAKYKDKANEEMTYNASIETYYDAISEIVSRGGWVIRIGDKSANSLRKTPQVIDYAKSKHKSDWMDIFLLGAARFMLGTSSGPSAVSYVFGVPIAMTNFGSSSANYLSKKDIFLPKLIKNLDNNTKIPFSKLMSIPYGWNSSDIWLKNLYNHKSDFNTSEDIKELAKEMLDRVEKKIVYSDKDEEYQNKFKKITAENEVLIGFPNFPLQCRIGRSFLNKNKELLN